MRPQPDTRSRSHPHRPRGLRPAGVLALLTLPAAPHASAQPANDNCPMAEVIAGLSTFPWSTAGAATDGLPDALCNFGGSSQIDDDVWFIWTAPQSAAYTATTCGVSLVDTKLAVYDSSSVCNAFYTVLDCNDDDAACAPQSSVTWLATQGATYLLRLGTVGPQGGGGLMLFSAQTPPCRVDLDLSGVPDVPDIFIFLSLWFANDPIADWDYSGLPVAVPDIFAYLTDWFAGC